MTERELLMRVAEAASLHIEYWAQEDYPVVRVGENTHGWNPLKFNSDALALAVRMEMDVFVRAGRWTEAVAPMGEPYKAMHGVHGDAETATRFAITMAALGKPTGNPADWAGRMLSKLDKLRQYDAQRGIEPVTPAHRSMKMEQDLPPGDLGSNAGLGPTPPLPRKKPAVFHHPTLDMPLYDGLAMDLHAMTYAEPLFAEIVRLRAALKKANDQAEHFERLWYLTNEDAARYAFAKTLEGQVVTMETFKVRGAAELDQAIDDAMAEAADAHNEAGYAA